MSPALTKRKKQILDYLQEFQVHQGYFPTLEEIADKFKLKSQATVHQHLSELENMGLLKRTYNKARDMQITTPAATLRKELSQENYVVGATLELPIVGLITAGIPIEAIEDRTETMTVPKHLIRNENAYVLKVKGDSMIESLIADGDYVVVQKQDYAKDGDIVVALLEDGSATLKEYHREKNYVRLQPRNKNYKPIKVRNVIIQGTVQGIIRKFSA